MFGQRPKDTLAASPAADLHVFAPTRLRGGLYYEGRITIDAKQEIKNATVVLDSGWTEQMQINTVEPSPVGESSRDGKLTLEFGHVPAGQKLVAWHAVSGQPDERRPPLAGRCPLRRHDAPTPRSTAP